MFRARDHEYEHSEGGKSTSMLCALYQALLQPNNMCLTRVRLVGPHL